MRILFSSDWHLGYEMGGANRVERLSDQVRQMQKIAAYIEEHEVDVLAIAGDVFDVHERGRARAAVSALMTTFGPALDRGLTVVMIAGNHDRDYFMDMANEWLGARREAGPGQRIFIATRPQLLDVEAKGEHVTFVLLPFPNPVRYGIEDMDDSGGAGARNERIVKKFGETADELRAACEENGLPKVVLAHVTVEGTEVGPHRLSPRDDVVVPRSLFPRFQLTVVGHIHKAEQLGGSQFHYAGVLDRMDMGENYYEPRVLLADVLRNGVVDVTSLPLDPTPFLDLYVEGEDQLKAARDDMGEDVAKLTLVRLTVVAEYGTYTAPLIAAARELFPRLYGNVQHEWTSSPIVEPSVQGLVASDVMGTINRYLEEQVQDEQERAQLMELVEELQVSRGRSDWGAAPAPIAEAAT